MPVTFKVPLSAFRPVVDRVAKVVEKRNTIPILSNVLVRAEEDGTLSVTGTDLDIEATAGTGPGGASVSEAGAVTVPAALLTDILRRAEGEIEFADNGEGRVALSNGRARYRLNTLPASDFPEMSQAGATAEFVIGKDALTRVAETVAFAISTEETRYYLNGICFHRSEDGRLVAVATDGHRLSKLTTPLPDCPEIPRIIVPRKTIGLFKMLAESLDADGATMLDVALNESRIRFMAGDLTLTSKLIDGTFPDYERVVPKGNPHCPELGRKALAAAVDRVAAIASERGRGIRCEFGSEILTISLDDPAAGEAEDSVSLNWADGSQPEDTLTIGFNGRYLAQIIATFDGDTVGFRLNDPGSPAVLFDPEDQTRTIVLMPMRVG